MGITFLHRYRGMHARGRNFYPIDVKFGIQVSLVESLNIRLGYVGPIGTPLRGTL